MRLFSPTAVASLLLVLTAEARAQDAMTPETLRAVKDASVFIKMNAAGGEASGSGFVIKSDEREIHVATNLHVVSGTKGAAAGAPVSVIFNSGTAEERSARGEVVAYDPMVDLAVLRIAKTPTLPSPKPIRIVHDVDPVETMQLYTFGFPLGRILDRQMKNPAITVSRGSVSSLRRDASGRLEKIQIDGAINHGNSGGPLVDANGRLIGIAVQTVNPTVAQQIGLAIPREELVRMIGGYAGAISFRPGTPVGSEVRSDAEIILVDPFDNLKSVKVLAASSTAGDPAAEEGKQLDGAVTTPMTIVSRKASGRVGLPITPNASDRRIRLQIATVDARNVTRYSKPILISPPLTRSVTYDLRSGKAELAPSVASVPGRRPPTNLPGEKEDTGGLLPPFFTAVFSAKRKVAVTLDRDGVVRVYDSGSLLLKGSARMTGPAAHAALDGEAGILYAYVAVDGFLRFDPNRDSSPQGAADLHLYDIKGLLEAKEDSGTIDNLTPLATFPRNANAGGMAISPNGKWIFSLERERDDDNENNPCKMIRISTADRKPELELDIAPGTTCFCLSPEGRTIYAASRAQQRGLLQAIDTSSFEIKRGSLTLQNEPSDIEATASGFLLIACRGGQVQVAEMLKTRSIIGSWWASGIEPSIRVSADQKRIFTGDHRGAFGRMIQSWVLTGKSPSSMANRTGQLLNTGPNTPSLSGELFLLPDGQALLTRSGAVIPLGTKVYGPAAGGKPKKIETPDAAPKGKPKPIN